MEAARGPQEGGPTRAEPRPGRWARSLPPEGVLDRMIANKDGGVYRRDPGQSARPFSPTHRSMPTGEDLHDAVDASQRWLLQQQHPEGFWVGELEGDTILESEYILLMAFLGRQREA